MKSLFLALAFVLAASFAQAATLTWDRNVEADLKDYHVYACFTAGCTIVPSATTLQGSVLQPAVGVVPSFVIDVTGKEGKVAVSARDLTLNESGLSVQVPFDAKAPGAPVSPRFQ